MRFQLLLQAVHLLFNCCGSDTVNRLCWAARAEVSCQWDAFEITNSSGQGCQWEVRLLQHAHAHALYDKGRQRSLGTPT